MMVFFYDEHLSSMLRKSHKIIICLAYYASKDILLVAACFNNWSINTFFRQDFMRIGTQTALLYSKILPKLYKQCFIIFSSFLSRAREKIFSSSNGVYTLPRTCLKCVSTYSFAFTDGNGRMA